MAIKTFDVLRVADELHQAGEHPTQTSVRKHLGGGSYTTINAGLKEWRDKQSQQRADSLHGLVLTIEQIIDIPSITKVAGDFARKELERERAAARERVDTVERELHGASIHIDNLSYELEEAQRIGRDIKQRADALERQVAMLEERIQNMATNERALVQRLDKAVEARAIAERKLVACEESSKLLHEQIVRQKIALEDIERGDEATVRIEDILNRLLMRMNQAPRLVDRLKHNSKGSAE
ncbi:DNA-binding protein [Geobacter anodireducens]